MRKILAVFSFAIAAFTASSPAIAQAKKSELPCLRRSEIRDVRTAVDNRSLFVQANSRKFYVVKLTSACHFLSQRLAIRFVEFAQNRMACLERGDGILSTSDFGWTPRCTIESIDYLRPGYQLNVRGPRGAG